MFAQSAISGRVPPLLVLGSLRTLQIHIPHVPFLRRCSVSRLRPVTWLSIELCWPEAVEIELEAQFVRGIKEESEKITAGEKRIIKRLRAVEVDSAQLQRFEKRPGIVARRFQPVGSWGKSNMEIARDHG